MKKINKKFGMIITVISLLIIIISLINAFGVSTSYWDDNPLKLAPGESKTVLLGLQNKVGNEDVTLRAELTSDGDGIAILIDENLDYFVPLGSGADVPIKVEIPEDIKIGGIRKIAISFIQISSKEGGMVRLTGGFTSKFPVEVVGVEDSELYSPPELKKTTSNLWILIIMVIIIASIVIFIARKKKLKNKK